MASGGVPDSAKAIGSTKTYLYRRIGTKADFVNGKFVKLVDEKYKDKLEPVPALLTEAFYYLAFSSKYYNAHKTDAETFWTEIAKVRASPAYKAKIK